MLAKCKLFSYNYYYTLYVYRRTKSMTDENEIKEILDSFKQNLDKTIDYIKAEFQIIRAGRANPHILDKVFVDYYGTQTPVSQMANIAVAEARLLTVNVWDVGQVRNVSKAISAADLGVNVSDDGRIIRLAFPVLTEERRKEIAKNIKQISENGKVTMRNHRRECLDFFKSLKKDGEISEDDVTYYENQVQKILDEYVVTIDKLFSAKEKEIMEV